MALAIGASSSGVTNFGSSVATTGVTTSATGSTFAVFIDTSNTTAPTSVTDNKGNTYTQKLSATYNSASKGAWVYTCENGVGGAGHAVTVNFASSNAYLVFFAELTGSAVWDLGSANTGSSSATQTTPSITTTGADAVIAFVYGGDFTTLTSITDTFGNVIQTSLAGATNGVEGGIASTVQGSAGSISDTFTLSASIAGGALIAAWKPGNFPPTISAQPTQQSYTVGGTATFSVTASGGTPAYSYQWQKASGSYTSAVPGAFSNIGGATSASYTTPTLASADEGSWYRCVVTDSASQSVTSLAAQLVQSGVGAQGRGLQYGPSGWAEQSKKKNASAYQLLRRQMLAVDGQTTQRDVWNAWFFPSSNPTGSSATTDGADVSSASGNINTDGSSATTDGADVSAASGTAGSGTVTGSSATTDGADTSSASGAITTTGSSATTDGADVSAASGGVNTSGSSATTDGADVSAASGAITTSGSSATTDGADTSSASGAITTSGSSATTDGADTSAASGTVGNVASGSSATTDGADVSAASGDVAAIGTSASTDGADVSSASGGVNTSGSSATTDGPDTSSGAGSVLAVISGSSASTDGADTSAASGLVFDSTVTGSSATTDGADISVASDAAQGGGGYDDDKPKKKKRYVVEVDGKIQVFASAQSANNALERAKPIEEQPKKVRKPVPVKTVKIDEIQDMAREREALAYVNQQLEQMQYERLLKLYEDWQDEEDIEALLMAI